MAPRPTPLRTVITRHSQLRRWLDDIRAQSLLLENLTEQLPAAIRSHCVAARRDGDTLIVLADSPVWATRLRYALPRIMRDLPVRNLRVRVAPTAETPRRPRKGVPKLPESAAAALEHTADSLDDPELSAVLRRIASHRQR